MPSMPRSYMSLRGQTILDVSSNAQEEPSMTFVSPRPFLQLQRSFLWQINCDYEGVWEGGRAIDTKDLVKIPFDLGCPDVLACLNWRVLLS